MNRGVIILCDLLLSVKVYVCLVLTDQSIALLGTMGFCFVLFCSKRCNFQVYFSETFLFFSMDDFSSMGFVSPPLISLLLTLSNGGNSFGWVVSQSG